MSGTFKLILISNVFQPTVDRVESNVIIQDEKPISFYLNEPIERHSIALNRKTVETDFVPQQGDEVLVTTIPFGGDSGKNILRFASLAAVTYFAPVLAGKAAGLAFGAFSSANAVNTFTTVAALGIQVAGSALVNNLLPVNQVPEGEDIDSSPTYGIDGAKTTARQGVPVPMVYGRTRQSGNVVGYFTDLENNRDQYVTILMCLGEGDVKDVTDIELNEQPIENYGNWTYA